MGNLKRYDASPCETEFVTDSSRLLGKSAPDMRNRIAERRQELGLTKTEVAKRIGTSKQHYGRLESGETGLDPPWLKKLAKALRCRPIDLLPELADGAPTAPLVGYVGAGEKIFNFDDGDLEQVEAPPGVDAVHVVKVRGDSMWPAYREGDLLFYTPTDSFDPQRCLYRDCVVQVVGGPTYVKRIIPGPNSDSYTLTSYLAPEILGARIHWAAPVLWVKRA
jgi:transcriptional regulator with XRE-family HTH domain